MSPLDADFSIFVTWTSLLWTLGIFSAVPTMLLGWLHLRMNGERRETREAMTRIYSRFDSALAREREDRVAAIAGLASNNVVSQELGHLRRDMDKIDGKMEQFFSLIGQDRVTLEGLRERITRLEERPQAHPRQ